MCCTKWIFLFSANNLFSLYFYQNISSWRLGLVLARGTRGNMYSHTVYNAKKIIHAIINTTNMPEWSTRNKGNKGKMVWTEGVRVTFVFVSWKMSETVIIFLRINKCQKNA